MPAFDLLRCGRSHGGRLRNAEWASENHGVSEMPHLSSLLDLIHHDTGMLSATHISARIWEQHISEFNLH